MRTLWNKTTGKVPNDKCDTEQIIGELYRCVNNQSMCEFYFAAGNTSSYCMHPNHQKFSKQPPRQCQSQAPHG